MNCEDFTKNIDAYLDGDMSDRESLDFERHLQFCEKCRLELMSFEKCIRLMPKFSSDANPPASIRKNVFEKLGCCDMERMSCCPPKN